MSTTSPIRSNGVVDMVSTHIEQPWLQTLLILAVLCLVAWAANWLTKQILRRLVVQVAGHMSLSTGTGHVEKTAARLANVVPAMILRGGIMLVPHLPGWVQILTRNVASAFVVITVAMAIGHALSLLNELYQRRPDADSRPIKGYVQVVKLLVYAVAVILMIAALIDQSPLLLLSGLGAMAAVLMLVFKDTILSLVASVQLSSNDMLHVGDWIEMPQLGADGTVIDVALHTVKVQNFDKTITTIPTYRLISESFRNWRGMFDSGGRRMMRSLVLDQNSIKFLSGDEIERLSRFALLKDYMREKQADVAEWNRTHSAEESVDSRRLTNIGTFRAYVLAYLTARPDISKEMLLIVRLLAPSENGLPLEIYAFTTTTQWAVYEGIQSDIFDHLIAILPEFGLRAFQRPAGADIALPLERLVDAAQLPGVR